MSLSKSDLKKLDTLLSKMETSEDYSNVVAAVKSAYNWMGAKNKSTFRVGQTVTFTRKNGDVITGMLVKKNPKYQHVKTEEGTWKVPASMLTAA